jgi:hypothetical protein
MAKPIGSLKTGGRLKGTPNKKSQFLSDALETKGIDVATELVSIYKDTYILSDRAQILFKLLDYCYPKKKSIESNVADEEVPAKQFDYSILSNEELEVFTKILTKLEQAPLSVGH